MHHSGHFRVSVTKDDLVFASVAVDGKPRYVFPKRDCALLPILNTSVEMLAKR